MIFESVDYVLCDLIAGPLWSSCYVQQYSCDLDAFNYATDNIESAVLFLTVIETSSLAIT